MDKTNPYLSPGSMSAASNIASSERLHSTVGVVIATFFGTLTGGGLLLALNYWRTKQPRYAWTCLVGAFLLTVMVFIAAAFLPENLPNSAYIIPQLVFAHYTTKYLQGEMLAEYQAQGGRYASRWAAVGWGLLCALIIAIPLVTFVLFVP